MKKNMTLILKHVGSLAVASLTLSANTTSAWIAHQPEVPNAVNKFKKMS